MKAIVLMSSVVILMSGCIIQSIYPFYTEETKVEKREINGEWISIVQMGSNVEKKAISPWSFSDKMIVTYDKKNIKSNLKCTYFKVGDNLFVDTIAAKPDTDFKFNLCWTAGMTLVHTVCKVNYDHDILEFIPINFEWFEDKIKDKKLDLTYVKADKDSNYIFTVTSEDWTKFLKKHGDNPEVFNKKYSYTFKRK